MLLHTLLEAGFVGMVFVIFLALCLAGFESSVEKQRLRRAAAQRVPVPVAVRGGRRVGARL